jgi:hypothetical protein
LKQKKNSMYGLASSVTRVHVWGYKFIQLHFWRHNKKSTK